MEKQKSLQARALVGQLPNSVQNQVNDLLSNGVVSSCIIVGRIFLARHQLLRMEQLTVSSSADLINYRRFQIHKDCSGYMLSSTCLGEKGTERVVSSCFVGWHSAIRLDAMLQAIELPTGIANLGTSLSNVYGNALTLHKPKRRKRCMLVEIPLYCPPSCFLTHIRESSKSTLVERRQVYFFL